MSLGGLRAFSQNPSKWIYTIELIYSSYFKLHVR